MGMVWVFDTGDKTLTEALTFPHHYLAKARSEAQPQVKDSNP
jgi:hypothetical protein